MAQKTPLVYDDVGMVHTPLPTGDTLDPAALPFATLEEVVEGVEDSKVVSPATVASVAQSGVWNYAVASGTENDLVAHLIPAMETYTPGFALRVLLFTGNTGTVTIDVDGLGQRPVKRLGGADLRAGDLVSGSIADLIYDGGQWQVVGLSTVTVPPRDIMRFSEAGPVSWEVPTGITWIRVTVVGGGGGGGGIATYYGSGGGGGGGSAIGWVQVTPGAELAGVVGAGGAGGAVSDAGEEGGTTSFAGISATGGHPGKSSPAGSTAGGIGGEGIGGSINYYGGAGDDGDGTTRGHGITGINGIFGGSGGATLMGGGGRAATVSDPTVQDGRAPGSGGGGAYGTTTSVVGGDGAPGTIIIEY